VNVEEPLFTLAEALRVPVLVLALACLAVVVSEVGAVAVELRRHRRRSVERLEEAVAAARAALAADNPEDAHEALRPIASSPHMANTLEAIVDLRREPQANDRIAKRLAEYDYRSLRRLERTRILVRMGPALGLMGTLIPLSPALAGLARGHVDELAQNLRVAFGITVVGLLVGAIAFAISLIRDRLYAESYSDVEFVAATLAPETAP